MPPESLFVAVGHHGTRLTSPDGLAWRTAALGKEGEVFRAVAFGNGRCAAVGSFGGSNILAGTADGVAWNQKTIDGKYSRYARGLGFGGGQFVAAGGDPGSVGAASPFVFLSADGEGWSDFVNIPGKYIVRRLAFGNGVFCGVGDRGRRCASRDGRDWSDAPNVRAADTLVDVAFGGGTFVGVGLHGLRMRSADGLAWSERQTGDEGEHLNSVVWDGGRFVAVGQGATYFSADGAKWERQPNRDAPLTAAFGNGVFVGTNWRGRLLRSADAVEWAQAHKCEHHLEAVAFGPLSRAAGGQ